MISFAASESARRPLRVACMTVLMSLLAWGSAQAASFSDPITVTLIAPGGYTSDGIDITPDTLGYTQSLLPSSDSITPAGSGDISGFMQTGEFIQLNNTTFVVRAAEGASNGTTGYLGIGNDHARYDFTGLRIAGQVITGVTYTLTDTTAPILPGSLGGVGSFVGVDNASALAAAQVVKLNSPTSFEVDLDQLHFKDRLKGESGNFVDITVSFTTAAVPEPSSAWLAVAGLMAVAGWHRRRASAARDAG